MNSMRYEVFISYSHRDNRVIQSQPAWVDELHRSLESRVGMILGEDVAIWRDEKDMDHGDYFDDVIFDRIKVIPFMICILSPSYANSKYCKAELEAFYRQAQENGGLKIQDKPRIIKVVKMFVSREAHPPALQGIVGYEFYQKAENPLRDELEWREFNTGEAAYMNQFEDLARYVAGCLRALRGHRLTVVPTSARASVYLAETIFDLNEDRSKIKRELEDRHFKVLPDEPLPMRAVQAGERVRAYLADCKMSVHMLGKEYAIVPQGGGGKSLDRIQVELAAERFADPQFARVIWMRQGVEVEPGDQQAFVDELKANSSAQKGREILQTSLEELKTYLLEVLDALLKPPPPPPATTNTAWGDMPRIYLICHQQDFDGIGELLDFLYERQFQLEVPATVEETQENAALIREAHEKNLIECDAALLYYANGNEFWFKRKTEELRRCFGNGRPHSHPWKAKAILVTPPKTTHKKILRSHDPMLINALEGAEGKSWSDVLSPFLNQLLNGEKGEKCG
jgi:TIR domain